MRLLILIVLFFYSSASAQTWTIQTNSYRDYRLAQRSLDRLINAGFTNAYTEFYMEGDKQFVRTRVGCFYSKEAAREYLDNMQSFGQTSAYVVANSQRPNNCIKRDIGFITPEKWGVYRLDNERVVFWVSLADLTAFIAHDASGWHISQSGSDLLTTAAQRAMTNYFIQETEKSPIIFRIANDAAMKLSTGKLLWQSGLTAIVQEADTIVSYEIKGGD